MEPIQHDPITKAQVKSALYEFLYTPVEKQFQNRLNTLIIKNAVTCGYGHKSFNHRGVLYTCDSSAPPRRWNKLAPHLKDDMDKYLQEVDELNRKELPYVLGYINKVLNSSNNFGDYLKLFPDCLHPPIKKLIDSCPCHTTVLDNDQIDLLTQQNRQPIDLIKQRMMTNMLL
jgi:hypothetical protein